MTELSPMNARRGKQSRRRMKRAAGKTKWLSWKAQFNNRYEEHNHG
jgi:hypothetical protein